MSIAFLLVGLLIQQPDTSPAETPGTLLQPMAVVAVPQPGETYRRWAANPLIQRVIEKEMLLELAEIGEEGSSLGAPAFFAMWDLFFQPLAGDVALFVDSLAGDGLHLMLLQDVLVDGVPRPPRFAAIAQGHDGEIAMDCLGPALQMTGVERSTFRGEEWVVELPGLHLMRQGDRFLLAQDADLLRQLASIPTASWLPSPDSEAFATFGQADAHAWLSGDLLRSDGFPDLPEDAGASYLAGEVHEILRTTPWIGMRFGLQGSHLRTQFAMPAPSDLRETHAPFLPAVEQIPIPRLERRMMEAVFTRDLAHWWAARSEYMSERGLTETIEGDSNLALLFGRDAGSEVFVHLENQIRLIAAPLPAEEAAGLSVEYPAGAVGLRFREDAPEDLGQAFKNAFFAAITFANFDGGSMNQGGLELDILPVEGGRLYAATYPSLEEGQKAPTRYNFSPALLVRDDGELWISSSLGLLHEIAAAPTDWIEANGMWTHFEFPEMAALAQRDRALLVANQMLEEGGDLERAEIVIDLMLRFLGTLDRSTLHGFLDQEDLYRLDFSLHFRD